MANKHSLSYLRAMFANCMLLQVIYVLCLALWIYFSELKGHTLLIELFPGFKLLDVPSFLYGLIASGVFVCFYNFCPRSGWVILGKSGSTP